MSDANKYVLVFILGDDDEPATGLLPEIIIIDLQDNSIVVDNEDMSEVSGGFYKFKFSDYIVNKNYAIRIDTGLAGPRRWQSAGNESFVEDVAIAVGGPIADFDG